MLEAFRRNLKHFHWILWLIILAFIGTIFLVWGRGKGGTDQSVVAVVNRKEISRRAWQDRYQNLERVYRQRFGEQFDRIRESFDLQDAALNDLIRQQVLSDVCDELGVLVGDEEVRREVMNTEAFQESGSFSAKRYDEVLLRVRMTRDQYERQLRGDLALQKLEDLIKAGVMVSDTEVNSELRRREEKVKVRYLAAKAADLKDGIEVSEGDLERYLAEHASDFARPETRRADYVLLAKSAVEETAEVTEDAVKASYEADKDSKYTTEEQVRARHILVKAARDASADDQQKARAKAEAALARVRAGADFAEVAKEVSEDSSAAEGGDLGLFGRGRMVPEFEAAVFSLEPGATSDIVQTDFGFHIVRVEARQPRTVQPFEQVKVAIEQEIRREQADAKLEEISETLSRTAQTATTAQELADRAPKRKSGTTTIAEVGETGFFGQSELVPGIGRSREFADATFATEIGKWSAPTKTFRGYYFIRPLEKKEPHAAALAEVRADVQEALKKSKAMEKAREKMRAAAEQVRAGTRNWEQAAADLGTKSVDSELIKRGAYLTDVGRSEELDKLMFSLAPGELGGPLEVKDAIVLVSVVERQDIAAAQADQQRESLRKELRSRKQNNYYSAWVQARIEAANVERML
ncbi:MAG: SurA N-terminal domain-containing protein [Candidatus Schekmanbacteria bacterium]|nr:SurA N-terminal domain-containing protein [Candidatus Schekmanbacteria bacterium]